MSLFQIQFNSDKVPHCSAFDIDLKTKVVRCVTGGFTNGDEAKKHHAKSRDDLDREDGPIVKLDKYFGKDGVP